MTPRWIVGSSRSGKTACLIEQFCALQRDRSWTDATVLVMAANSDTRLLLQQRLVSATQGQMSVRTTTPLGFFQDEVVLFWPLLIEQLHLKAQFPLILRPENEQELALRLWHTTLAQCQLPIARISQVRLVRRMLDFLQLAAQAGIPTSQIPEILEQGLTGGETGIGRNIGQALQHWQDWCLERGLLSYGVLLQLYGCHLFPHPLYQERLWQRFRAVLADDVDEYPAITRTLFAEFVAHGCPAVFTYNPDGAVRWGLGADPHHLQTLAQSCQVQVLTQPPQLSLVNDWGETVLQSLQDPTLFATLPNAIQSIQTTSRAQLLRRTADVITEAVKSGQVQPQEIAVIAPGMDLISRYTLREILTAAGIPVLSLNEQRPLASVPIIRALLTLLALVYPGLGKLVDRNGVAELLTVLRSEIDPVRAALIADHCFQPDLNQPQLLPITAFPRWDRLGYQASQAYTTVVDWLTAQRAQYQQRLIPGAVAVLDRAIQYFLWSGTHLPYEQLTALRELLETAQRYWDVEARLHQWQGTEESAPTAVASFIELLRGGTVTANPFPVNPQGQQSRAVMLANVFQYRSSRTAHRWQFWMDTGSPRWLTGIDALYGAPIFIQERLGLPWSAEDAEQAYEQRLRRILLDLLSRAEERVFLCHSDLATNGQEQTGPLLSLLNASVPLMLETLIA